MAKAVAVLGAVLTITATPLLLIPGHEESCGKDPLTGVYKPSRLKVLESCVTVKGTVVAWRHEHDGDYHVSMKIDDDIGPNCDETVRDCWTNGLNDSRQHGFTVVEFIPILPKPKFKVGQRLELVGTKVLDLQHGDHKTTGWVELHPVFSYHDLTKKTLPAKPNPIKLAPPTEEHD